MKKLTASLFFLLSLLVCLPSSSFAHQSIIDQQATEMEKKLIAPCCWAKTLDQEQSQVAVYMKQKIRTELERGKKPEEIYKMFEEEFGERVYAEPSKSGFNLVAWIFPFILMIFGAYLLVRKIHRLRPATPTAPAPTAAGLEKKDTEISEEDQKYKDQIDKELYRN